MKKYTEADIENYKAKYPNVRDSCVSIGYYLYQRGGSQ